MQDSIQQTINRITDELIRSLSTISNAMGSITAKLDSSHENQKKIIDSINKIQHTLTNDKDGVRKQVDDLSSMVKTIVKNNDKDSLEKKKGMWTLRNLVIIAILNGVVAYIIYTLTH